MSNFRKKFALGGLLFVIIASAVAFFGPDLLASLVRDKTLKIMEEAAGPRSHVVVASVQLDLLAGDISWTGLRITQAIDSADTSWSYHRSVLIAGDVGRLDVKGLSIRKLLLGKTLDMRSVRLHKPQLVLIASDRKPRTTDDSGTGDADIVHTIRLDSLMVDSGNVRWRNTRPDKPEASVQKFTLGASGIAIELPHGKTGFSLKFVTAAAEVDSLHAGLPPLYDLTAEHIRIAHPDSTFFIRNMELTSRKGPQEYKNALRYETDLTTFHTDSVRVGGLDLAAGLNSGTLAATTLRISGTKVLDFRDKTMTDAPYKVKPMPAKLLRDLPFGVRVDTLLVDGLDVEYNEKDVVTSAFGQLRFTNIIATVTGLDNTRPERKNKLRLVATARVYETAPVRFKFESAVFDSSDHFSARAHIGALPFTAFNAMTNDLLLVKATAGSIGGIEYTLDADKNKGHGRVDMEYSDLKVRIAKRDGAREKDGLKSFLANQLVRSKNLSGSNFRHGDFTVERKKDRQIFNYMWSGLREGMMETVLPQAVKDVKAVASGGGTKAK
ncbi:MAG: hypothetical protein IPN44_08970 [Flavobacteriales bacterium]|nr:hypothetical protein [Flavobacteriales bacterium]